MGNVFSNIGHAITKGVTDAGHFTGKVLSNPIVDAGLTFIPGVGPGIAAGAGALGGALKPGGNLGSTLTGGVKGYAMGKLGSGVDDFLGKLAHGDVGGIGSDALNLAKRTFGGAGGVAGGIGGLASGAVNALTGGGSGSGMSPMDMALAGTAIDAAGAARRRQQGFQNQAADAATGAYNDNSGLRTQARSMLQNNQAPDLSSIFADPGNVYSRVKSPVNPAAVPVKAVQSSY